MKRLSLLWFWTHHTTEVSGNNWGKTKDALVRTTYIYRQTILGQELTHSNGILEAPGGGGGSGATAATPS